MSAALAVSPIPSPAAGRATIRVAIADDSAVVRGLVSLWLGEAGFEVVATAPNGRVALDAVARPAGTAAPAPVRLAVGY